MMRSPPRTDEMAAALGRAGLAGSARALRRARRVRRAADLVAAALDLVLDLDDELAAGAHLRARLEAVQLRERIDRQPVAARDRGERVAAADHVGLAVKSRHQCLALDDEPRPQRR